MVPPNHRPAQARLRIVITGAVQGVGFRPFVHHLAGKLQLTGWVQNNVQGVVVEVEGPLTALEEFRHRIQQEKPNLAHIATCEPSWLTCAGYDDFKIVESASGDDKTAFVMPDIATCPECLIEIFDPQNRRFHYPFTNCTKCGPRFSIITALPYDRANTSMARFTMCSLCRSEYENPADRRFHAEPNACPACGPSLQVWDADGAPVSSNPPEAGAACKSWAVKVASHSIASGHVVALKGIGGFQLLVDARNRGAVLRLRKLKQRDEKPFAVMFPSLDQVRQVCDIDALEEQILKSPQAPIVLLQRRPAPHAALADSVAPHNPLVGAMLPYSPLHHLLLSQLQVPVVATSGNLSDEPICTDEFEAGKRLKGIADLFLVHNRPIVRHVDDSIVQVVLHREMILRRARGYAPLPIHLSGVPQPTVPALAVGGHLKNTVALCIPPNVFMSQHIGDLDNDESLQAFRRVIDDFQRFYAVEPGLIAADLHPEYLSTQYADARLRDSKPRPRQALIQHHVAHVLSCMAENQIRGPVLGVAWDGTGLGTDGKIWGGEFFRVIGMDAQRVAHFRCFILPGPIPAMREPRRSALGILYELLGPSAFGQLPSAIQRAFSPAELVSLKTMLLRNFQCIETSSVGRLFDAVAALLDLRQVSAFEGQAAMAVEFLSRPIQTDEAYTVFLRPAAAGDLMVLDWSEMLQRILDEIKTGVSPRLISARLHNTLVQGIVQVARHVGFSKVVLSGGCFQNRTLLQLAVEALTREGFEPFWHRRVPPNDGGISLGQVVAALHNSV